MKFCPVVFLSIVSTGAAFSPLTTTSRTKSHQLDCRPLFSSVASSSMEETFYEAVQKAEKAHARIDIDEYDRLATELENFEGIAYEKDAPKEIGEKEIQDRLDVAEILRLQIELHLRIDYLKNANLFADDARKEHDASERKKMKEALMANREKAADSGSDLGLW